MQLLPLLGGGDGDGVGRCLLLIGTVRPFFLSFEGYFKNTIISFIIKNIVTF